MTDIKFIGTKQVELVNSLDESNKISPTQVGENFIEFSFNSLSKDSSDFYHFQISGSNVQVSGQITEVHNDYQFFNLFAGCEAITDAGQLIISAPTAKKFCFANMFLDCTNLTTPPQIQANTLDEWCYSSMFGNCSSLTAVPTLPATGLAPYCYYCMFYGCKSLSSAPYLSAQTLEDWCYNSMFYDCKNLTSISADFNSWSENATTNWVTGIKTEGKFYNMNVEPIYGVDNIPESWSDYLRMPLTFVSDGVFAVKINKNLKYKASIDSFDFGWKDYNADSWLISDTPGMKYSFSGDLYPFNTNHTFSLSGNSHVTVYGNPHSLLNWRNLDPNCFAKLFKGCTQLVDASNLILSSNTLPQCCFDGMFEQCSSLTAIPALPATTIAPSCYQGMFNNCTSLSTVPTDLLPAQFTWQGNSCYCYMFAYCINLRNAPELPSLNTWSNCYNQMFANCHNLTDAPYLPAETLRTDCYKWMFANCYKLSSINVAFTDWKFTSQYNSSTYGWVSNVAANGVFTKPSGLPEIHGPNRIPQGWTVINT